MFEKQLTLSALCIRPEKVYEQMGYGKTAPDARTVSEVSRLLAEASEVACPHYCYTVMSGVLDGCHLQMGDKTFHLGRIIARQLKGAESFAVFLATAGEEFEKWRKSGDLFRDYLADALGSVIAERCADVMENALQASIDKLGWKHTNRFSPGYCEWHVSEQQQLIPLLGSPNPCGVVLTDSSLMWPVKSVSGIIGLGPEVTHQDYTCHLCKLTNCVKRKR